MGWKNVKEYYRIEHAVQVTNKGICIGSPYIHDLIVISLQGEVVVPYRDSPPVSADLARYQREIDADPAKLRELVLQPDTFTESLSVYTFHNGEIVEKQCEVYGWPNVTHDGEMMYENRFSPDRDEVIRWARKDNQIARKWAWERITQLEAELSSAKARFQELKRQQKSLRSQKSS